MLDVAINSSRPAELKRYQLDNPVDDFKFWMEDWMSLAPFII
jgi:hypothetical protein